MTWLQGCCPSTPIAILMLIIVPTTLLAMQEVKVTGADPEPVSSSVPPRTHSRRTQTGRPRSATAPAASLSRQLDKRSPEEVTIIEATMNGRASTRWTQDPSLAYDPLEISRHRFSEKKNINSDFFEEKPSSADEEFQLLGSRRPLRNKKNLGKSKSSSPSVLHPASRSDSKAPSNLAARRPRRRFKPTRSRLIDRAPVHSWPHHLRPASDYWFTTHPTEHRTQLKWETAHQKFGQTTELWRTLKTETDIDIVNLGFKEVMSNGRDVFEIEGTRELERRRELKRIAALKKQARLLAWRKLRAKIRNRLLKVFDKMKYWWNRMTDRLIIYKKWLSNTGKATKTA